MTKQVPFTREEIDKLKEEFGVYIKTVIDLNEKICSAGASRHLESEKILIDQGSIQSNLWGGGIDLATKTIDYNSFINIRPNDENTSNEIQSPELRKKFAELMQYYFKIVL